MRKRYSGLALIVALLLVLSGAARTSQPARPGTPAGTAIAGKVTNSEGGPLEGAQVTAYQIVHADAAALPEPKVMGQTSTGAGGTFALTISPGLDRQKATYVVARKKGLALGWASWQMPGGPPLDLILGEAKDLAGEVVDEKGQPVVDAQVRVEVAAMGKTRERRRLPAPAFLRARTDSNGRFIFPDMPADATFEFSAQKPGLAAIGTLDPKTDPRDGYQFSPGQAGIKLVLPPETGVEGVIVDKTGQPVGGAWVLAVPVSRFGRPLSPRSVPAASDGTFRLRGLAAGDYTVRATAPAGPMTPWTAEPVEVSLKAGETRRDVKLQLTKGGLIEVLVKDAAGQPVANAIASVRDTQSGRGTGAFTDANGLAQLRVLPGQYTFSVTRKEAYVPPVVQRQEQIAIADGQTNRIEFVLSATPKVMGIVRDETGNPLAGVKFEVLPTRMVRDEITSDASGRFEAAWDPATWGLPGTTFVLVARDVTHNLAEAMDLDERGGTLDLKLKPGVVVTGAVLGEEGQPLPGARIRTTMRGSRWIATLGRSDLATAGPDGRFEIKALPPQRQCTVSVVADGYGRREVLLDPGDAKDNRVEVGQIRLVRATLSITGVVVDPNEKLVVGANVYGFGEGQPDPRTVQTDGEGRFVIQGVCPGPIRLQVSSRLQPTAGGARPMYGSAQTEGGATDLRIVISARPTSQPSMFRRPVSLRGNSLPPWKNLGIDLPAGAEGKMLLVCFWDMGQRPSRYCLTQLAAQAGPLGDKGVLVIAVHAAKVEDGTVGSWLQKNKISFVAGTITGGIEKTKLAWGVDSLPHLILTDEKHTVVAEGFGLSDLDKQIEAAARR